MTPKGVVGCRASPTNVRPRVVLGLEVRTAGRQEEKQAVPKDSKEQHEGRELLKLKEEARAPNGRTTKESIVMKRLE